MDATASGLQVIGLILGCANEGIQLQLNIHKNPDG
mgnify:CR=1 FL=1